MQSCPPFKRETFPIEQTIFEGEHSLMSFHPGRDSRPSRLSLLMLVALTLALALPSFAADKKTAAKTAAPKPDASTIGSWTAPVDAGVVGIHAAMLHTGKVLMWYYPQGTATNTPAKLVDPVTNTVTDVTIPFDGDFFCSGLSFLADGRLLVTGGLNGNPFPGVPDDGIPLTAIFDPVSETWTAGPPMNVARWYPTNVELPSGKILTLVGKDQNAHQVTSMEVFDPAANTWTLLPTSANTLQTDDTYLKMKVLPTGNIFMGGAPTQTRIFHTATNTWTNVGLMNFGPRYHAPVVLLPGLKKALTAGGTTIYQGGGANATVETIDLSVSNPTWVNVAPMNIARYNHEMVILADGNLLVVGGAQVQKYSSPIMTPELYNVTANTWTNMADLTAPRTYHSTALLLPDGRVFSAGSDDPNNVVTGTTYQIFSPPYLSIGARPIITSAPTSLTYGQSFDISNNAPNSIVKVALIRPAAVTHSNDMDQRYVTLAFTRSAGKVTATAPANANQAPPGWYMLVIVNSKGVPSVMPFLQLQ